MIQRIPNISRPLVCITATLLLVCGSKKDGPPPENGAVTGASEMVLVPAGWFWMGSPSGEKDEQPVHRVWLDSFYIDQFPVTNARYDVFVAETNHPKSLYRDNQNCNDPNQRQSACRGRMPLPTAPGDRKRRMPFSHCRPKRNGKKRPGETIKGRIPGETIFRIKKGPARNH